ncbi:MAG TPA: DsbA family protein [Solirubrobacterales bacterium]|jgi:protein-disulfide isomerase|nr:DsbA family protein [Solirubrobacterales bacterium]
MEDLTSAPIPSLGPEDHVRGEGEVAVIVYADLGCPHCAAEWRRINQRNGRIAFRHFPIASKHPRAPALHAAAEAAGRQGRFFEMVDSLYADRGRVDDPHLWERIEELGLDLERFEADRRAPETQARIRRDFESGIRAGVSGTPALFDESGRKLSSASASRSRP